MTRRRVLAIIAGLVLVVGACSSGGDGDTASFEGEAPESAGDFDGTAGGGAGGAAPDGSGTRGAGDGAVTDVPTVDLEAQLAGSDRRIVYRGEIVSQVDDVAAAVGAAKDAVGAEGGYVFGQQSSEGSARLVFKVPSVRFDAAFEAVAGIGEVASQFIEAEDVSDTFVDLESRQGTLEASIARLRGFLERSSNVEEISRLESELTRREAERDIIAGQLRVLDDRTAFATITVSFGVDESAARNAAATGDDGPPGFGRGLEVGADAVLFVIGAIATAAGFLLPFVPVLLALAGLVWWLRRRRATAGALTAPPSPEPS